VKNLPQGAKQAVESNIGILCNKFKLATFYKLETFRLIDELKSEGVNLRPSNHPQLRTMWENTLNIEPFQNEASKELEKLGGHYLKKVTLGIKVPR